VFERFDEDARRALFFARYEVAQLGGITIEPEHLVLGILRGSSSAILRFAKSATAADDIRKVLARPVGQKVSTSVEIPFSRACMAVLEQTPIEADSLGNGAIRCEHMLLGVLVRTAGDATRALHDAGVQIDDMRTWLKALPEDARSSAVYRPPEKLISRHWKGVTKPGQEAAYLAHLERETFPALTQIAGFLTATVYRRAVEAGTEFLIVTIWRSLDAIKAFAGDDIEAAVVPPAAQALLASYDRRAVHYEIIDPGGTQT
jgi:heme-degrading monooxygenase HmoA